MLELLYSLSSTSSSQRCPGARLADSQGVLHPSPITAAEQPAVEVEPAFSILELNTQGEPRGGMLELLYSLSSTSSS